jgi:protein-tyrosine phosphatase
MIDVHCHLLPGIDDGAQTLDDSIELINLAIADGITHIVATPHIHPGRFNNDTASIATAYRQVMRWVKQTNAPIKLSTAAEVRISIELLQMLEHHTIPFVGQWDGYNVILLEMPHSHILPGSDKLIKLLLNNNIRPLIAHPERNKEIMAAPEKIKPFVDLGCLLQVTAGALVGRFIATDAHNTKHRPPKLAEAYALLDREISQDYSLKLKDNVSQLVSQKPFNA